MKKVWKKATAWAAIISLAGAATVGSARYRAKVENAYRSLRDDAVKRAGYESREEAKKGNAIRQVSEEEAWKSYLSKHKGANPSQQAMKAISEVSTIYLRSLPPEQRIEKAIQIIVEHGKNPKKTAELKERIRKEDEEIQELEKKISEINARIIKLYPVGRQKAAAMSISEGIPEKMKLLNKVKLQLQKNYEELLVFESFIIELSKQTRK